MSSYLKILGFQLVLELESNFQKEYVVKNKFYEKEMDHTFEIISEINPDIVIYPEMSYINEYEKVFQALSKDKFIIAGSIYRGTQNTTIIFQDTRKIEIPKLYASGAEPMVRYIKCRTPQEILKNDIKTHFFKIHDKQVIVLNCMEYYHLAYFIAREYSDIFAIISPCSNNNPMVFKEETKALHNHNENIYSFVINCISTYNKQLYGKGQSYVYGPIQYHEKKWLMQESILMDQHVSSILNLDDTPSYFYGEFTNDLTAYGRSDNYLNNPQNLLIRKLGEKK